MVLKKILCKVFRMMSCYSKLTFFLSAIVLIHFLFLITVQARTKTDDLMDLQKGDSNVLLGAFVGEVSVIRQGIEEGGSVFVIMAAYIGEVILGLGKSFVDFPLAPALHLAIYQGEKKHLEAAFYLMNRGANINSFRLEKNTSMKYTPSYPPGILFALGFGSNRHSSKISHAGFLQRLHQTLPNHFNLEVLEEWRVLTGNPPLLHIPVLADFFDGLYILVTALNFDINVVDQKNLTVLHIAAWRGDVNLCKFLIFNGADVNLVDAYGRTAVHYAAMRGHTEVIYYILNPSLKIKMNEEESKKYKRRLLFIEDYNNRTALQLSASYPPLSLSMHYLQSELNDIHDQQNAKIRRSARLVIGRTLASSIPESQPDDQPNTLGGWHFPTSLLSSMTDNIEDENMKDGLTIDILSSHKITKGSFRRDYFFSQRPVLITNHLASKRGIWAYWQKDAFLERYGGVTMTSGEINHAGTKAFGLDPPVVGSLKEWVELYMSDDKGDFEENPAKDLNVNKNLADICSSGICFTKEENNGKGESSNNSSSNFLYNPWVSMNLKASDEMPDIWEEDFRKPDIFNLCGPGDIDNEPMRLYVGTKGSGVPIHSHEASWNLLVTGIKKWFFIAPGYKIEAMGPKNGIGIFKVKTVSEWMRDVLPGLKEARIVFEVYQYPGDVVFIPHDWLHATFNFADTISVSQEFCTLLDTDHRMHPLGFAIYGGDDTHRGIGRVKNKN
mmetsp:Transcript_16654/g.16017  ORF Transcript_16654/g.16017 Transcript_16654/m.16017 type:complete len:725 (+) Transcript_16654:271-2445(+)